jgi:hypothetical protein
MDSVSLHTMARRYLMSRIEKLPSRHGGTSAALTIQKAVDRLDRDDLPPPRTLAAALATAASAPLDRWPSHSGERDAISAERERFRESVRSWVDRDLVVEPLPYRRVFGEDEAASWARRIEERWGSRRPLWDPQIDGDVPEGLLVLQTPAMWDDGPGVEPMRRALRERSPHRVIEIREPGTAGSLIDADLVEPFYTGVEAVWTDETLDWVVYASHHWTVEVSGTLVPRLKALWPDLDDWLWVAPDWY